MNAQLVLDYLDYLENERGNTERIETSGWLPSVLLWIMRLTRMRDLDPQSVKFWLSLINDLTGRLLSFYLPKKWRLSLHPRTKPLLVGTGIMSCSWRFITLEPGFLKLYACKWTMSTFEDPQTPWPLGQESQTAAKIHGAAEGSWTYNRVFYVTAHMLPWSG